MAEGNGTNGNGNGGPWWSRLLERHGPLAVIALILVLFLTNEIAPVLKDMSKFMIDHQLQMGEVINSTNTNQKEIQKQWGVEKEQALKEQRDREYGIEFSYQQCVNTAKSAYQTQKCESIRDSAERAGAIRPREQIGEDYND